MGEWRDVNPLFPTCMRERRSFARHGPCLIPTQCNDDQCDSSHARLHPVSIRLLLESQIVIKYETPHSEHVVSLAPAYVWRCPLSPLHTAYPQSPATPHGQRHPAVACADRSTFLSLSLPLQTHVRTFPWTVTEYIIYTLPHTHVPGTQEGTHTLGGQDDGK